MNDRVIRLIDTIKFMSKERQSEFANDQYMSLSEFLQWLETDLVTYAPIEEKAISKEKMLAPTLQGPANLKKSRSLPYKLNHVIEAEPVLKLLDVALEKMLAPTLQGPANLKKSRNEKPSKHEYDTKLNHVLEAEPVLKLLREMGETLNYIVGKNDYSINKEPHKYKADLALEKLNTFLASIDNETP